MLRRSAAFREQRPHLGAGPLPRFFFNVRDGSSQPDLQGVELADLSAARIEAVRLIGALLNDQPQAFWDEPAWDLEVCDDYGLRLFVIRLSAEMMPGVRGSVRTGPDTA